MYYIGEPAYPVNYTLLKDSNSGIISAFVRKVLSLFYPYQSNVYLF